MRPTAIERIGIVACWEVSSSSSPRNSSLAPPGPIHPIAGPSTVSAIWGTPIARCGRRMRIPPNTSAHHYTPDEHGLCPAGLIAAGLAPADVNENVHVALGALTIALCGTTGLLLIGRGVNPSTVGR